MKKALFFKPDDKSSWREIEGGVAAYRTYPKAGDTPEYGYLRIFTFDVAPERVAAFTNAIANVLRCAPEAGLVIDVRSNPGGNVYAAEGLLQLFSAGAVSRQGVQFLNTPEAVQLARAQLGALPVGGPAANAIATGAPFVVFPEMPMDRTVARATQVYQGPVVVIVDANSYSAAEMFAAGMQDHDLAIVIGTYPQTGGGGGILWSDEGIAAASGDSAMSERLAPLPGGASFEVAVLRTTRAGENAGAAVEDMGVAVRTTDLHRITVKDVLHSNEDLRASACKHLAAQRPKSLVVAEYKSGSFTLRTEELDRVDMWVDEAPYKSYSVAKIPKTLPAPSGSVVFRGVKNLVVVTEYHVTRRIDSAAALRQPAGPGPPLPPPPEPQR